MLAKRHHPDMGGNTRTMQDLNGEYETVLHHLDGYTAIGTDAKEHTYHYHAAYEQAVVDQINRIIQTHLPATLTIELLGTWIWIGGTQKDDLYTRKLLGTLHFAWHSKREKWYWKPAGSFSHYRARLSYNDLRQVYGASAIRSNADEQPALN